MRRSRRNTGRRTGAPSVLIGGESGAQPEAGAPAPESVSGQAPGGVDPVGSPLIDDVGGTAGAPAGAEDAPVEAGGTAPALVLVSLGSPASSVSSLGADDAAFAGGESDTNESSGPAEPDDVSSDDVVPYVLPSDGSSHADSEDEDEPSPVPATAVSPGSSGDPSAPTLPACVSLFRSVEELYGYLLLRGARPLNEDQYMMVRTGFDLVSPVSLPSLTHIRDNLTPRVRPWMLPTRSYMMKAVGKEGKVAVECILPSAHVRRDVAFEKTYQRLVAADKRSAAECDLHPEFVDSPIFQARESVVPAEASIRRFTLDDIDLSIGDAVTVVLAPPHLPRRVVITDAYYTSHHSGVAQGAHVHAGDFLVCCDADGDGESGGCLVARHWQASVLPPLSWVPDSTAVELSDVVEVQIRRRAADVRGTPPTESHGEEVPAASRRSCSGVKDGVDFITVSICLNSDDFESRRGKHESLGGVYMSYLSMLFKDLCSSNACRTIASTPPSVNSDDVLRAITPDLKEGASTGWLCRRADGSSVRVFADVAMFVGDYLQVTKTSQLMGYGAKSPCPLCTYRVPGVPGSRYGLAGSSADAGMARTSARTRSICRAVANALSEVG